MGNEQSSCSGGGGADQNAVAEVQQLIGSNAVMVFAKSTCPYCAATKLLLRKKGVNYKAINVDTTCEYPCHEKRSSNSRSQLEVLRCIER